MKVRHTLAVLLIIITKDPQLLKLIDDTLRLELNILEPLAVRLQLEPEVKGTPVRGAELFLALLVVVPAAAAAAAVVAPVGDCLLQLVALQLLVRPVLDGSLDGQVECLAGLHELLAEVVGLPDRDAGGVSDVLLGGCEGRLSVSTLEEDGLFGSVLADLSVIE